MITPIVIAGGSGTRLWPHSRKSFPKQFINIVGKESLLQQTLQRLTNRDLFKPPLIICNERHRFLVRHQCEEIGIKDPVIIIEPEGKNTAAAISSGVLYEQKLDSDFIVLSSDHFIDNQEKFIKTVTDAQKAISGDIFVFGVKPRSNNPNYGYIQTRKEKGGVFSVESFIEKPESKLASKLIQDPSFFWNSGIFMFNGKTFIKEMSLHNRDILDLVGKSLKKATSDIGFLRLDKEEFSKIEDISFDYALLEKTSNIKMVQLQSKWNDLGTWESIYEVSEKDSNGNVISGDVILDQTSNCFISSEEKLLVSIGIDNLNVINTPDVTLISTRNIGKKNLENVLRVLKESNRIESEFNRKVHRPWGSFETLVRSDYFQVKKLSINPRSKLSLQMHNFRSEHWVVVKGTAIVTKGEKKLTLKTGDSVFIPKLVKHSVENKTKDNLEIIETQSGAYLGEDDITRYEDIYGRIENK